MTNPPWTLGDAEHLSKWTSGICGSSSWCLGELNLVVNEAKNVIEKQTPLPSHSVGTLAGKCMNKEVSVQLPEETESLQQHLLEKKPHKILLNSLILINPLSCKSYEMSKISSVFPCVLFLDSCIGRDAAAERC